MAIFSFFSTLFTPVVWIFLFFFNNLFYIFASLLVAGTIAFLLSYYFYGFVPQSRPGSPKTTVTEPRKVSTIAEVEEDVVPINNAHNPLDPMGSTSELRRMRKRDWAKKIYKSIVSDSPERLTPSDDSSNDSNEGITVRPRKLHRRHTSGPLQIAKDLLRRGSRHYFRQQSDLLRDRLPMPPQEFFEPTELPEIPQNLSPEIFYILHNLKMLELPAEWMLNPVDIQVRTYEKNEYIVRPGDPDDSIYVAIDGCLCVYITHAEGKEYMVKRITAGNSFFSLLSMIDILMNQPSIFRTVSLKASEKCRVAKFQITSFRPSYQKHPEAWIRPIQIVITRLLHVTMTTLHQYMGLSSELMKSKLDRELTLEDRNRQPSGQSLKMTTPKKRDRRFSGSSDQAEQLQIARTWFAKALCLPPEAAPHLVDKIELKTYDENSILTEPGKDEEQLIIVLSGTLSLLQSNELIDTIYLDEESLFEDENQDEEENTVARVNTREMIGGLQLLTSEPAFYTVKAAAPSIVAVMSKKNFNTLLEMYPDMYLPVAASVIRRLSPFLRGVDFALDWVLVDSGQSVYREGDVADSLYVMLSGRLRSVEKKKVVEEFGRGDVLGMMEVLQKKARSTTVMAVRFSQLARIPEGLLNFIKMQFPQVGFRLVQLLGQYYSTGSRRGPYGGVPRSLEPGGDPMSHIKNLHTIAVVPASPDIPLVSFTCELYHALSANLRVLRLSSQKVATYLDSSVLEKQADFRLMHWLNVQEDTFPLVIYECDFAPTNWTRRCLRQADAILVVANGTKKPARHTLLKELLNMNQDGVRTNKELILLWPDGTISPSGTIDWLKNSYFSGHHHILAPKRMFQWQKKHRKSSREIPLPISEKEVIEYYEKHVFWTVDHRSDFARLARILTGNAIGLVLGGGGARGAAHVGVLHAMREQGIPVDIVGGTSIGSMIGGLYAETPDNRVEDRARSWFEGMTSLWRKILDLTYAHTAMFTGHQFNGTLKELFGDREIEDLWIPYFCISTDISTSEMRVHRSGPLWAYARASMSLAGYLPPLCDPQDGHLLLDGGYVNNLPADVMRSMGARCVIAVDVGSVEETNLYNYGDSLSGFWVLMKRLNPFAEPVRVLNMEEIQSRLAYVSCVRQLEIVKKANYCHYLRPPIEPYKTLDFGKFNEIMEIGYSYGRAMIIELLRSPSLQAALNGDSRDRARGFNRQTSIREKKKDLSRATSFTDLAAAMSKIPTVRPVLRHCQSAIHPGEFDDLFDDIALLEHSDADNELSQSDYASSTDEEPDEAPPKRDATPQP